MKKKKNIIYSHESIVSFNDIRHFYKYVKDVNFNELSLERMYEIDGYVNQWFGYFTYNKTSNCAIMSLAASRMVTSNGKFGVVSWDEKLYFYIRLIDHQFNLYKFYTEAKTMDELKIACINRFGVYDPILIRFETKLLRRIKQLKNPEDSDIIKR